ncbi:ashwin-like [Periplaneta americana]|uniref:ashwin-like n=1 Tax=Periplaneta americana TaxID=6978 RepID=UPI0037E913E0
MASNGEESSDFYLFQPELLNETLLRQILEQRCVKLQSMNTMTKAQLVEIFYRVAVPLPQRIYKENRRGKLLTKMRGKQERSSRKSEPIDKKSNITYGLSEASTSRDHGSHNTGDRLKPPPDAINFERKKIKLNSSSSSRSDDLDSIQIKRLKKFDKSDTNGDILDRIIINDRRKEKEEKSESQSMKQKTVDDSSTNKLKGQSKPQDSHNSERSSGSRKIILKRSHSSSCSENPNSTNTTTKDSEVKKQKTKIMWP